MPYACSAGDTDPVVVHLQQLDGDFEVVDFCAQHWVQFVYATAETLGMFDPGDVDGMPEDPTDPGFPTTTHDDPDDPDDTDPGSGDGSDVRGPQDLADDWEARQRALSETQRDSMPAPSADEPEPAPH